MPVPSSALIDLRVRRRVRRAELFADVMMRAIGVTTNLDSCSPTSGRQRPYVYRQPLPFAWLTLGVREDLSRRELAHVPAVPAGGAVQFNDRSGPVGRDSAPRWRLPGGGLRRAIAAPLLVMLIAVAWGVIAMADGVGTVRICSMPGK